MCGRPVIGLRARREHPFLAEAGEQLLVATLAEPGDELLRGPAALGDQAQGVAEQGVVRGGAGDHCNVPAGEDPRTPGGRDLLVQRELHQDGAAEQWVEWRAEAHGAVVLVEQEQQEVLGDQAHA